VKCEACAKVSVELVTGCRVLVTGVAGRAVSNQQPVKKMGSDDPNGTKNTNNSEKIEQLLQG
jgi:hypothetical protein